MAGFVRLYPYAVPTMSERTRTPPDRSRENPEARDGARLRLVRSGAADGTTSASERLHLPPSRRLEEFVHAAAEAGLEPADAVRLALERALALADAAILPLDVEAARSRLSEAAARARAGRPLTAAQSAYVRSLSAKRARPTPEIGDGLVVVLPDRVLTRARDTATETAFHAGAVAEMAAWEIAATLEGRTMGEWALRTLAADSAAVA